MDVKHGVNKFYIGDESNPLALMTYVPAGDSRIIINHTEVSDQLRGQGAGKQMVESAVLYARSNNLRIMPLCPFAKSVFDKTKDYQDVLN